MKKAMYLFALLLMGITGTVKAQTITFDEMAHNFGKIEEGPEYKHTFKFKNTGNAPLIINNVVTPCGCTTPNFTREPVMPGKTGEINVSYNSAGRMGGFDKILTVQTNMGADKDQMISIKGEVVEKGAAPKQEETKAPEKKEEPKKAEVKKAPSKAKKGGKKSANK